MALLDQIKDLLLNGPDDWRTRVRETIDLTSPEGSNFVAKWQNGPRSFDKKLGIFEYPRVKGNIVQDMDCNSTRYSLSIFFDGADHDKDAARFFTACRERGTWQLTHPIHGFLELQLVSVRQVDDPVGSGGITAIESDWIEPIDPLTLKTAAELVAEINTQIDDLNISAAQQFADNLNQDAEAFARAVETATTKAAAITDAVTSPLFDSIDALDTAITAIQGAINDTITQTTIITDSLAGQLQQLTQLPSLGAGDGPEKVAVFDDLVSRMTAVQPSTVRQPEIARNQAAVVELSMSAAIGAVAKAAVVSPVVTRADAINLIESISTLFDAITTNLDASQSLFEAEDFDTQFFSQSQTYNVAAQLVANVNRYLLTLAPSLQIEKRIVLERPRAPIEIVITEYGTLGDSDENLELFISTNELKGDDIIFLDRGREVVIYA